MTARARTDYGLDAPGLIGVFFIAGAIAAALAVIVGRFLYADLPFASVIIALLLSAACYLCGMGSFMIYESRIGKVRGREAILNQAVWHGHEEVLDVGCGRGLMLIGAAKRLSTGHAVGVDIWQARDQSGNSVQQTLANAAREGVSDRVEVRTADMRALPFADAAFDMVLSHWVVHNLDDPADRDTALAEMVRVLRPEGTLILTDIAHRAAYAAKLHAMGVGDVRIIVNPLRDRVLNIVSGGSFRPATIVATKPRSV